MLSISGSQHRWGYKAGSECMFRGMCAAAIGGRFSSRPQEPAVSPRRCGVRGRKSGRSLQCASRGGACEYSCARAPVYVLPAPGSPVLQSLHDEEIRAPQAARGGIKGNVTCVSSASFP